MATISFKIGRLLRQKWVNRSPLGRGWLEIIAIFIVYAHGTYELM